MYTLYLVLEPTYSMQYKSKIRNRKEKHKCIYESKNWKLVQALLGVYVLNLKQVGFFMLINHYTLPKPYIEKIDLTFPIQLEYEIIIDVNSRDNVPDRPWHILRCLSDI